MKKTLSIVLCLVLMLGLAWLYFSIGVKSGWMTSAFIGVQIAVLAVIVRAAHRIGRHVMVDRSLWFIGAASCAPAMPSTRRTVACSKESSPISGSNCLGYFSRDSGHKRVPEPPERTTG